MSDIDSMTANQIDAEIGELAKLERTGELTVRGHDRLNALRFTRSRIGAMGRARWM